MPTVIDSFYLVTLGSYRFFYILNWIVRGITERGHLDPIFPISVIFGVVQTTLYIDFAWVYFTRQRVKLRGGGVVDGEDLSKGWLISKIIGRRSMDVEGEDDEERRALAGAEEGTGARPAAPRHARSWGARGISVSADDGVVEDHREEGGDNAGAKGGMTDPANFEDDVDDDAPVAESPTRDEAGNVWQDHDHADS